MSYTLSVVIPCYNEVASVEELLKSVKNVPIDNIEIIVVLPEQQVDYWNSLCKKHNFKIIILLGYALRSS